MLLWLTLALLWSPTCWAAQTYGRGGGTYFSTSPDPENEITGIRVSFSIFGQLMSIQVRYGSSWSETCGHRGVNDQEFILRPGEHIIGVYGSYKLFIRQLFVYTDQGRGATFGMEDGLTFIAYPDYSGQVLTGVFGHYTLLGISDIGFEWGEPLIEATTITQSTTP
ncbi:pancreatic adenocarcinoma up-regulated factor-like [Manis javanica]|uniref:pancreatic adenocarcinoma up-regulated factor-like n=1 Tax=Manis javanica TaxID=9974 RepID=UPI003C6CE556